MKVETFPINRVYDGGVALVAVQTAISACENELIVAKSPAQTYTISSSLECPHPTHPDSLFFQGWENYLSDHFDLLVWVKV